MEIPSRKQNRIDNYDYSQAGAYFVTICTQNRNHLFEIESCVGNGPCAVPKTTANQILHKWIRKTANKFPNISINKYVIMPDHIHMILTIEERPMGRSLPDIIRFSKTMTTNEYIRGVKNGLLPSFDRKLWQKSYYDHIIRNEKDYNEIWEYIDTNPIKWAEDEFFGEEEI